MMRKKSKILAYTLIEILTVLAVIGLLLALLIPAFVSSKKEAYRKACLSNIRQVGMALIQYTQDHDGVFPPTTQSTFNASGVSHDKGEATWSDLLLPYVKGAFPFCPIAEISDESDRRSYECGYAQNNDLIDRVATSEGKFVLGGQSEAAVSLTSLTVSISEARVGIIGTNTPDDGDDPDHKNETKGAIRHDGGANYAFLDGHAKWHRPSDFVIVCDGTKPCFQK